MKFIKVGNQVINLANVAYVELNAEVGAWRGVQVFFTAATTEEDGGIWMPSVDFRAGTPEADYLTQLFSSDNLKNLGV